MAGSSRAVLGVLQTLGAVWMVLEGFCLSRSPHLLGGSGWVLGLLERFLYLEGGAVMQMDRLGSFCIGSER